MLVGAQRPIDWTRGMPQTFASAGNASQSIPEFLRYVPAAVRPSVKPSWGDGTTQKQGSSARIAIEPIKRMHIKT